MDCDADYNAEVQNTKSQTEAALGATFEILFGNKHPDVDTLSFSATLALSGIHERFLGNEGLVEVSVQCTNVTAVAIESPLEFGFQKDKASRQNISMRVRMKSTRNGCRKRVREQK